MAGVPIIRLGEVLIATVQEDLYDYDALQLQEDPGQLLEHGAARGVLLDLSTVATVDSFLARLIGAIAAASRLLGAETVVVGLQPAVALTLVELGLRCHGIRTALNAERVSPSSRAWALMLAQSEKDSPRQWELRVAGEEGIVAARQQDAWSPRTWGFGLVDQSRIATAVSELTRNVVRYGNGWCRAMC